MQEAWPPQEEFVYYSIIKIINKMANQIDPRARDKEIQRQQAVQNTIDAKVEAHQALTDSDIQFI